MAYASQIEEDRRIAESEKGKCPRDGQAMLRVYSPKNHSVVIDTGMQCGGIWLDDEELPKITAGS